ncbi:MAG: hypothetical protein AUK36_03130 [Zetaproteobacteria bacterium CG2_30_59_37]|nr:MAG: hypothetical protein AUK36_03130 [Zetaproteobacteria bacterium CG2_30_59_37]
MARLFAYGTLMCPEIMQKVAGMTLEGIPGLVKNHICLSVRGEAYPGMVKGQGGVVQGLLYTFSSCLWPVFDAFEGEDYVRKPVTVWLQGGKRELVHAYLFRPACRRLLTRTPWDFGTFLKDHKQSFIVDYLAAEKRPAVFSPGEKLQ